MEFAKQCSKVHWRCENWGRGSSLQWFGSGVYILHTVCVCYEEKGGLKLHKQFIATNGNRYSAVLCTQQQHCPTGSSDEAMEVVNENTNGALCDAVQRTYNDILCLQHVMRFHGTHVNVISFIEMREVQLLLLPFCRNSQRLTALCGDFLCRNSQRLTALCGDFLCRTSRGSADKCRKYRQKLLYGPS
jgi:hypothetical protein